jgi:GNAT superfamily N-acetyltransferase
VQLSSGPFPPNLETTCGAFVVSTDPSRLDVDEIHRFLAGSYWAAGIPRGIVERSIAGSLCFGLYEGTQQVGFARVITDRATYAYLADVYVEEAYRGKGLGEWLLQVILAHPDLQSLRRFALVTRDAQRLYAKFGFASLSLPELHMEIHNPDVYLAASER